MRSAKDIDKEERFRHIFDIYYTNVFNYTIQIIGDRKSAEDLTQDVFIKIYKKLSTYHDKERLSAWVFTITRNTIHDYFRKQKVRKKYYYENLEVSEPKIITNSVSPEQYLISKETKAQFEKIIIELPFKLKETFLLRHEANLSFKEISKLLNCPVNRLLGRMHLAVKKIRSEMEKYLYED